MSEQVMKPEEMMTPSTRRSRVVLLGIFAAFVGPLLLAYVLLLVLEWAPESHTNNGSLIDPATPVGELVAVEEGGATLPADFWDGHWTLVYYAEAGCDLYCEAALFKARQVRLALGRDAPRVERLYLEAAPVAHPPAQLLNEHPGMSVARIEGAAGGFQGLSPQQLYLVDPMGNLVLAYDDDVTAKGLMKDLKRLLKVSKVG